MPLMMMSAKMEALTAASDNKNFAVAFFSTIGHLCCAPTKRNEENHRVKKALVKVKRPSATDLIQMFFGTTPQKLVHLELYDVPKINNKMDILLQGMEAHPTLTELQITCHRTRAPNECRLSLQAIIQLLQALPQWVERLQLPIGRYYNQQQFLEVGAQLSRTLANNCSHLQSLHLVNSGSGDDQLLVFLLQGLAQNKGLHQLCVEPSAPFDYPSQFAARTHNHDHQQSSFYDHELSQRYGRERAKELWEETQRFETALADRTTRLKRLVVRDCVTGVDLPLLSRKGNFLLQLNETQVLDCPENAPLWVETLIAHKEDPCWSCHILLSNPAMFVPMLQAFGQ